MAHERYHSAKGYARVLLMVVAAGLCMGFKACQSPNAPFYGTWALPAQFDLRDAFQDSYCGDDVFNGLQPFAWFYGIPAYAEGPGGTATAPVAFWVSDPSGNPVAAPTLFRVTQGNGFNSYHFEGILILHNPNGRIDFFQFNAMADAPLVLAYEVTSGHDGCMNHFRGVILDSTECHGGHAGCTTHQTTGWVPHLSTEKLNACDWRPWDCTTGNPDIDGDCPAWAPYAEDNGTCCSCN